MLNRESEWSRNEEKADHIYAILNDNSTFYNAWFYEVVGNGIPGIIKFYVLVFKTVI